MFNKDLLVIDLEATGADVRRHELIEIGAILLDKKTLKQKASFQSFIKPKHWAKRDPEAMAVNRLKWEQLKDAPSLKLALTRFNKAFPHDAIPVVYGGNMDVIFLDAAYKQQKLKYPFDYHTLNMWALCYAYMAARKLLKKHMKFPGFSLESIAEHFKIKVPLDRHTALADCLLEAEVLRNVVKAFRKI
jgi:DNA polymerase III epsilon subunit-like protein